jgi:hypothetical protein
MIYTFLHLRTAGVLVGLALVAMHTIALLHGETIRSWLLAFPRSRNAGFALLTIAAIWAFTLVAVMDLGEFSKYQRPLMILIPAAWFLSIKYVDEFLAVRASGMLLLLLAEPVLEAAFLRPETSRLLLVVLAYVWIVAGMFWVGMPYVMRNQIAWITKTRERWIAGCAVGIAYGAAILICSATLYRSA